MERNPRGRARPSDARLESHRGPWRFPHGTTGRCVARASLSQHPRAGLRSARGCMQSLAHRSARPSDARRGNLNAPPPSAETPPERARLSRRRQDVNTAARGPRRPRSTLSPPRPQRLLTTLERGPTTGSRHRAHPRAGLYSATSPTRATAARGASHTRRGWVVRPGPSPRGSSRPFQREPISSSPTAARGASHTRHVRQSPATVRRGPTRRGERRRRASRLRDATEGYRRRPRGALPTRGERRPATPRGAFPTRAMVLTSAAARGAPSRALK